MSLTLQDIIDADIASAGRFEEPSYDGLQALTAEQQDALLDYLASTFVRARKVSYGLTSANIARFAKRELKKQGIKLKPTNLQVKSAMRLLGFETTVEGVTFDIEYYKVRQKKEAD